MSQSHLFEGGLRWTGTANELDGKLKLERALVIDFPGKPPIRGSSPAVFNGDDGQHNPESLMISSLMACHLLTYLAVCERAGIRVVSYEDRATGAVAIKDGKLRMVQVVLRPQVTIADAAQIERALASHDKAHANCIMANSVHIDVKVEPVVTA